jgi:hypothetical protein
MTRGWKFKKTYIYIILRIVYTLFNSNRDYIQLYRACETSLLNVRQ